MTVREGWAPIDVGGDLGEMRGFLDFARCASLGMTRSRVGASSGVTVSDLSSSSGSSSGSSWE